jgi:hypothetical protein
MTDFDIALQHIPASNRPGRPGTVTDTRTDTLDVFGDQLIESEAYDNA